MNCKRCQAGSGKFKHCTACRAAMREIVYKSREKLRKNGGMRERERLIREYYARLGITF